MKFGKILSTILVFTLFTGCTNDTIADISSISLQEEPAFPAPDQSVAIVLNALKDGDIETLNLYVENDGYSIDTLNFEIPQFSETDYENVSTIVSDISTKLYKNLEYEIVDSDISGDTAIVTTTLITPNGEELVNTLVADIAVEYTKNMFSGDATEENIAMSAVEILSDHLDSPNIEMIEATTEIKLKKGDEYWIIVADEELYDTITGGTISASKDLIQMVDMFVPGQ